MYFREVWTCYSFKIFYQTKTRNEICRVLTTKAKCKMNILLGLNDIGIFQGLRDIKDSLQRSVIWLTLGTLYIL